MRGDLTNLVAALDEVPELAALLANPETDSRVKGDVVVQVVGDADELTRNFLRLLAEKGRAGEVREVTREFEALVAEAERILDVELTTAHELTEAEFDRILGRIEQASGRKVQASRRVDPELIGGIVLQAGSLRLDASVRGRLEQLRRELAAA